MEQVSTSTVVSMNDRPRNEWAKLIRKLQWIGYDDEAFRIEQAVNALPPEKRGSVSAEPSSTD